MYSAMDVAKYIINVSYYMGHPVSNLRLQKLLYFVQGNSFYWDNEPMFMDEIYAWKYGPVVPEVYFEYARYVGGPIEPCEEEGSNIRDRDKDIIYTTVDLFRKLTDWQLVDLSHEDGSPWSRHKDDASIIPKSEIKEYFVAMRNN